MELLPRVKVVSLANFTACKNRQCSRNHHCSRKVFFLSFLEENVRRATADSCCFPLPLESFGFGDNKQIKRSIWNCHIYFPVRKLILAFCQAVSPAGTPEVQKRKCQFSAASFFTNKKIQFPGMITHLHQKVRKSFKGF